MSWLVVILAITGRMYKRKLSMANGHYVTFPLPNNLHKLPKISHNINFTTENGNTQR